MLLGVLQNSPQGTVRRGKFLLNLLENYTQRRVDNSFVDSHQNSLSTGRLGELEAGGIGGWRN